MSGETVKRGNFEAYTSPEPQMANFHTAIYEGDYDGLLIALCNQNGAHPWQINAILAGLNGKNEAADLLATERAAREKAERERDALRAQLSRIEAIIPASLSYEVPDPAEAVASTFRQYMKVAAEAAALRAALIEARTWHEAQDKVISKQPNANIGSNAWMRSEHQEQMHEINTALTPTGEKP